MPASWSIAFQGLDLTFCTWSLGRRPSRRLQASIQRSFFLISECLKWTALKSADAIRRNPQYANIIIIMLTSVGEVEDKIKGIDIGANDYVVKPFGLSELFEVVARVNRFLDTKGGYLRKVEEEKFTTLRGAANTVCHEINNPLTADRWRNQSPEHEAR